MIYQGHFGGTLVSPMEHDGIGVFRHEGYDVLETSYDETDNAMTVTIKNPSARTNYLCDQGRLVICLTTCAYRQWTMQLRKIHQIKPRSQRPNSVQKGQYGRYTNYETSGYYPDLKRTPRAFKCYMQTPDNPNAYLRAKGVRSNGVITALFELDASSGHSSVADGTLYAKGLDNLVSTIDANGGTTYKVYYRIQLAAYASNKYSWYNAKMSYIRYYHHGPIQEIEYPITAVQ